MGSYLDVKCLQYAISGLAIQKLKDHNFIFNDSKYLENQQLNLIGVPCKYAFRVFDKKSLKEVAYSKDLEYNKFKDRINIIDSEYNLMDDSYGVEYYKNTGLYGDEY